MQRTRVGCSCLTVKKASLTSIANIIVSWCSRSAKKQIGKMRLAMFEVAGEKSASLSGCNHVYSLATKRLRRNQMALPCLSFYSPHVRTKRVLKLFASSGKLSSCKTWRPDRLWISTCSAMLSKRAAHLHWALAPEDCMGNWAHPHSVQHHLESRKDPHWGSAHGGSWCQLHQPQGWHQVQCLDAQSSRSAPRVQDVQCHLAWQLCWQAACFQK